MAYGNIPLEKRLKENIRNYGLEHLFEIENLKEQMKYLERLTGVRILLTERHGEKMTAVGNFADFRPDVVKDPGRKLRVADRTVGHIYVRTDQLKNVSREETEKLLESLFAMWERLGEETYVKREMTVYLEETETRLKRERYLAKHGENQDVLTGVLNKNYFEDRLEVLDRAEVVPAAAIEVNINDWKYANDHYGDEESDRLISVVADILRREAQQDYVIGRVDGDVFRIIIPTPNEGEAEAYLARINISCEIFEDPVLTPSIATGMVIKTNVEEKLSDVLANAEYEMFQRKFEMKQDPAYQKRLRKEH